VKQLAYNFICEIQNFKISAGHSLQRQNGGPRTYIGHRSYTDTKSTGPAGNTKQYHAGQHQREDGDEADWRMPGYSIITKNLPRGYAPQKYELNRRELTTRLLNFFRDGGWNNEFGSTGLAIFSGGGG